MIVDVHVHLIGIQEINGCFVSPKMSGGVVYHLLARALGLGGTTREELDEAYRKRLVDWVHGSQVDAIGVLGLDGIYTDGNLDRKRTQVYVSNDYVLDVCKESEQLLPICSVNPSRKDALDELTRVVEAGSVAIKWLPNSQDFDPANPDFKPFYQRMKELEVPLLTHTSFEHTIPPVNQLWGKPERLSVPLDCGVTVIAAHCAGAGTAHLVREDYYEWVAMLPKYPRFFGDISAMASLSRFQYLARVLDNPVARDRVVFGSDFPVPVSPMVFARKIGLKRARELSRIKNPLQQNLETMQAMGVDDAILHRAPSILRM
jgi:predicted TIM-barrel fold metal-dependent hydrolase